MIDWISCCLPVDWVKPLNGGKLVKTDAKGKVELEVDRRLSVTGSYDATITVRTIEIEGRGKFLEISGNPIKFLQGHNLFGTNNLHSLVLRIANFLCQTGGITPTESNLKDWHKGNWTISRLDITEMLAFRSRQEVRSVLHALKSSATMLYRGHGHWHDGTLYFGKATQGKRAPAWSLKLYCKGDELELDEKPTDKQIITKDLHYRPRWGGNLPRSIREREKLCEYANNKLRIELTLRTVELKKIGLYTGLSRTEDVLSELFITYLSRMQISKPICDAVEYPEGLSINAQRTLSDWKRGADLRLYMNRQTLYRHRKQILEHTGLDISTIPLIDPPTINLQDVLIDKFKPEPIPDWAATSGLVVMP